MSLGVVGGLAGDTRTFLKFQVRLQTRRQNFLKNELSQTPSSPSRKLQAADHMTEKKQKSIDKYVIHVYF